MGGRKSLQKGKRGEREIIHLLQPIVDTVYADHPEHGDAPILQRNTLQSDRGGFDIVGLSWMAPEVKFHETLNVNTWWKQTVNQAGKNQVPVLFYRKSRVQWRVCMWMHASVGRTKRFYARADISITDFLIYFEAKLQSILETTLPE